MVIARANSILLQGVAAAVRINPERQTHIERVSVKQRREQERSNQAVMVRVVVLCGKLVPAVANWTLPATPAGVGQRAEEKIVAAYSPGAAIEADRGAQSQPAGHAGEVH